MFYYANSNPVSTDLEQPHFAMEEGEEHLLSSSWCFWHMEVNSKNRISFGNEGSSGGQTSWGSNLVPFGDVSTVEQLWSYYRNMSTPSHMSLTSAGLPRIVLE